MAPLKRFLGHVALIIAFAIACRENRIKTSAPEHDSARIAPLLVTATDINPAREAWGEQVSRSRAGPPESTLEIGGFERTARVSGIQAGLESTVGKIIVHLEGGSRTLVEDAVNVFDLAWAPDGRRIAFCEGNLVQVVDLKGGNRQVLHSGPGGRYPGACADLSWSEHDSRLSFVQLEHVSDPRLANPKRIELSLEVEKEKMQCE